MNDEWEDVIREADIAFGLAISFTGDGLQTVEFGTCATKAVLLEKAAGDEDIALCVVRAAMVLKQTLPRMFVELIQGDFE